MPADRSSALTWGWPSAADLRRTGKLGVWLTLWAFGLVTAILSLILFPRLGWVGFDAHAYWLAGRSPHPYGGLPGTRDAYLYSPVFVQLVRPLALMPWPMFLALWMASEAAVFVWLTAVLPLRWRIPVLLVCVPEVLFGNVYGFLAAATVLGCRRPAFWTLPLLTKITPGALGLLWLATQRRWRDVAVALLATGLLVSASFVWEPQLWHEWLQFLRQASGTGVGGWTLLRTLAAGIVVLVSARLGQPWLLAIALWLGAPVLAASSKDLALLCAIPRLRDVATTRATP
ncbi:MAG TPA: glycosyltransferase 87 family protein [Propionibacteriaceae bacterium]|nr:glycosyltransferase 87 family protein [Propionibacteriaceae bacterium]